MSTPDTGLSRRRLRARRPTPRRRDTPQESAGWWETYANPLLMQRSGGRCEHCGRRPNPGQGFERHHRVRRRDGGDRLANLLLLLPSCHTYITEHPTEAKANGWIVEPTIDPETVPVRYQGGHLWWLDDHGGRSLVP